MNLDEWNALIAVERATPNQRGAIMAEFERLGFHHRRDRAERLAACAALLGLDDDLGSTHDLRMGQAGQLVSALRAVGSRAELLALVATATAANRDGGRGAEAMPGAGTPAGATWPEVLSKVSDVVTWLLSKSRPKALK